MSWSITPGNAMRVVLTGNSPDDLDAAYATARKTSGWAPTPADEALMAVEWAANFIHDDHERGDFIRAFVAYPDDLRAGWPEYATWRAERLAT